MIRTLIAFIVFLTCVTDIISAQSRDAGNAGDTPLIESIEITGNVEYLDERLYTLLSIQPSSMLNPIPYIKEQVQEDVESLEQFYHDYGFLDASVSYVDEPVADEKNNIRIIITINEGQRTLVESVNFSGNRSVPETVLKQIIPLAEHKPFLQHRVEESSILILSYYRDRGFAEADVAEKVSIDSTLHKATVEFHISENKQFTINAIQIIGLEKTKESVVMREIEITPGELVNYSRLLEAQRKIYGTGLFRSVFIQQENKASADTSLTDVIITLKEKDSIHLTASLGYDTIEAARVKTEIYNNNLFGTARQIGISGRFSILRQNALISYTTPRIFNSRWKTDINTGVENYDESAYDLRRTNIELSAAHRFRTNSQIKATLHHEYARAVNIDITPLPDITSTRISSIGLTYRYDNRNSLFNTTKGVYMEMGVEWGGYQSGDIISYQKYSFRTTAAHPLSRYTVIASAVEVGFLNTNYNITSIPIQERFYAGGGKSIRGYEYNKVGPLDNNDNPTGGTIKLIVNALEVRQHIWKALNTVFFYDVGNVWEQPEDFDITDVSSSVGTGLRINTKIGVIRFDYGFMMDRPAAFRNGEYYISFGQAF